MLIINHPIYEKATGRIVAILGLTDHADISSLESNVSADRDYVLNESNEPFNQLTHYVVNGAITLKPEMTVSWDKTSISADGIDEATVNGVPVGSVILVKDSIRTLKVPCDDGVFSISSPDVETYTVELHCFPYQVKTQVIEAI